MYLCSVKHKKLFHMNPNYFYRICGYPDRFDTLSDARKCLSELIETASDWSLPLSELVSLDIFGNAIITRTSRYSGRVKDFYFKPAEINKFYLV